MIALLPLLLLLKLQNSVFCPDWELELLHVALCEQQQILERHDFLIEHLWDECLRQFELQ